MLNIKELKIGNRIEHKSFPGLCMVILEIRTEFENSDSYEIVTDQITDVISGFEEIKLDHEILKNNKFIIKKSTGYGGQDMWAGMSFVYHKSNLNECLFREDASVLYLDGYFNCQISTLHKLQNVCKDVLNLTI